jgi:hypothetical protein
LVVAVGRQWQKAPGIYTLERVFIFINMIFGQQIFFQAGECTLNCV